MSPPAMTSKPPLKDGVTLLVCVGIVVFIISSLIFFRTGSDGKFQQLKPAATYDRLIDCAYACERYKSQYGAWPDSMDKLLSASSPDFTDPLDKDAWGRELMLLPFNPTNGYGMVISYGRDGKLGGNGPDLDLQVRFPLDDNNNSNWNQQVSIALPQP
jgi:hypothetical protein